MAAPAHETEKRRAVARRVVDQLAAHTELRDSLLAGSAARGTSDEYSDIDLLNYYDVLPDPTAFDLLIRELGAGPTGDMGPPRPEGFAARYRLEGIELETGGHLIVALQRRLRRIDAGEVDWITAKIAMGLQEGLPLYGEDLVRGWQERAAYPDSLRRREVDAHLGFFPIWTIDDHLLARDAELFRRQMLLDGAFRVLAILSAVNRLYFTAFQFKRARAHVARMAIRPERLAERLDLVANAVPSEAARELCTLVQDTKAIVTSEMPKVDVDIAWRPVLGP